MIGNAMEITVIEDKCAERAEEELAFSFHGSHMIEHSCGFEKNHMDDHHCYFCQFEWKK